MVRFLHTSDWQLGMTRHYLDADAQPRFTGDRIQTVRRILRLAVDRGCAFVVVAGDVFEHPNLGAQDMGRALEAMGSQEVPLYLLPGNHDPLGTGSLWSSTWIRDRLPANVTVLDSVGPWPVAQGVEIVAAPWTSKRPDADPVAGSLRGLEADGTVRLLVGHGMLEDLEPDVSSPVVVRRAPLEAALEAGSIHYIALGDRHIRWPRDGSGAIQYSGAHESTGFREPGCGQVLEVELGPGSPPRVTGHEVGSWQHVVIARELATRADVAALAAALDALSPKERSVVKTALTGSLTIAERAELDRVIADRLPLFASLEEWDRRTDVVVVPDDGELAQLDLGGYVQQSLDHLLSMARAGRAADDAVAPGGSPEPDDDRLPPEPTAPPQHEVAQDAVRLLVRLTGGAAR
ncbi:exonuclease SbcCD subunit D [Kocuria coralli]|uniref:Nuclease SbcCD subunit D n=1 Tax=Kocuria coralli TaxID=1461025 RepID=A0A5J5L0Q3_9MICC|nr:metallophosphoesterase [Kocuria coralli]KAA9395507.1 exonuclease SbcCD subunit D [Kocuria coralli]